MKNGLAFVILFSLCTLHVVADEGMWMLGNLNKNKRTERTMKELGLEMPVNQETGFSQRYSKLWRVLLGCCCFRGWIGFHQPSLWL